MVSFKPNCLKDPISYTNSQWVLWKLLIRWRNNTHISALISERMQTDPTGIVRHEQIQISQTLDVNAGEASIKVYLLLAIDWQLMRFNILPVKLHRHRKKLWQFSGFPHFSRFHLKVQIPQVIEENLSKNRFRTYHGTGLCCTFEKTETRWGKHRENKNLKMAQDMATNFCDEIEGF